MITQEVISAVKKSFSRSKFVQQFKSQRVIKNKKGVRGGKVICCEVCGKETPLYKSQVDHIDTIVPVMIPAKFMSFMYFYDRTFCSEDNLQVLCQECHKVKSSKEIQERVRWRKRKKFCVCRRVYGCDIKIIPIIDMREFDTNWEILGVTRLRSDAEALLKQIKYEYKNE